MENPTFNTAFRGYVPSEVDDFLQEITAGRVTALEIYEKTFATSFHGYNKDQVDLYLDEIIQKLKDNQSIAVANPIEADSGNQWDDGIIK